PLGGNPHTRPNVIADPLNTLAAPLRGEDVGAWFEPVGEASSDFDRFVQRVISGQAAVLNGFASVNCEIAVQLDHSIARRDRFVRIDLDLVVFLGGSGSREAARCARNEEDV